MPSFDAAYAELVRFHGFLAGATCALNLVAAVLFFRFYRRSSDRLFLFFAAAFLLLACNRLAFFASQSPDESQTALYLGRLLAFCLILYGIVDKNRARKSGRGPTP